MSPDAPTPRRFQPSVHREAWVAPGATVTGDVRIGAGSSVWFGCVLRGDLEPIVVGDETNVQDLTVVHVDRGFPTTIGRRVTIGHRAVVHGAVVGDGAVIGMGAVVLSGARIGRGALVAAGSVVREHFEVPEGRIAAGVPARLAGEVSADLKDRFARGVDNYLELTAARKRGESGLP